MVSALRVMMVVRVEVTVVRVERVALPYLAPCPHIDSFQKHLPIHRNNVSVLITFLVAMALPSMSEQLKE